MWGADAQAARTLTTAVSECTLPGAPKLECLTVHDVCFDQQEIVTYDARYQPSLSLERPPTFNVTDVWYNWPSHDGNGDKFLRGHNLPYR
eukprot:gene5070-34864_t